MRPRAIGRSAAIGLAALVASSSSSAAQSWPTQTVKWVVPYPPGGNTDVIARAIADKIAPSLGQSIVIENRGGANTITGTNAVAKSDDRHTIGLVTDSHSINAAFGSNLPYDPVKDFVPVIQLVRVPFMLVANGGKVQGGTIPSFVAQAKASPGSLSFASLGPGSPHQIAMEWLRTLAGIDVNIVSYRGVAPALNDVVAGHVHTTFTGVFVALPLIEAKKVVALGVSGATRLKAAPGVPTIAEQGYPQFVFHAWYGVLGPKDLPREAVLRLNAEIDKAIRLPEIQDRIVKAGAEPVGGTPAQMTTMMAEDLARYREIIKLAGSKAN
jgi:tripartite-type tricarboxylate transporter receptor subunit TctC